MKEIVGIIIMGIGVIFGVYVGLWVCFIGGICDVIDAIKMVDTPAMMVALGIAKVVFASPIGFLCGGLPVTFGAYIAK